MTFNKSEVIEIPKWLIVLVLPMIVAGVVSYGLFKANSAKNEEKVNQMDARMEKIDRAKVDRNEFVMMQNQLNRIEQKLDEHISK